MLEFWYRNDALKSFNLFDYDYDRDTSLKWKRCGKTKDILDILVQVQCVKQDPLTLTDEMEISIPSMNTSCPSLLRLHFYYMPN